MAYACNNRILGIGKSNQARFFSIVAIKKVVNYYFTDSLLKRKSVYLSNPELL